MAKKRKPAKPSGTMVSVVFDGGERPCLESRSLPTDEAERELAMIGGFLRSAPSTIGLPFVVTGAPKKLDERDLDFLVPTSEGEKLFELAELRPHQGPYNTAPDVARVADHALWILQLVNDKSVQCHASSSRPVHLLLYVTHFSFVPSRELLSSLQHSLATRHHPFDGVHLYVALEAADGWCCHLFPCPVENPTNDVQIQPE